MKHRMGAVEGWVVTHDGETIKTGFANDGEALKWLHNQHSYSIHHAVKHEGYDIVLVRDGKVQYSYKRELQKPGSRKQMGAKGKFDLPNLVEQLSDWISEIKRAGGQETLEAVLSAARRILKAHIEGRQEPRNIDIDALIEDLDYIRDDQKDAVGQLLTEVINALGIGSRHSLGQWKEVWPQGRYRVVMTDPGNRQITLRTPNGQFTFFMHPYFEAIQQADVPGGDSQIAYLLNLAEKQGRSQYEEIA